MRDLSRVLGVALGVALLAASPAAAQPASTPLTVLTYNIHGLPWPLASDRTDDFHRIAANLRAMRGEGAQPHVVVLQEAFTPDAKAIGVAGGYRYRVGGPSVADRNPAAPDARDRGFAEQASWFRGEASGKLVDSGLQIFSDYPIIAVRRMPFPAFACAGYDCLANKGVLMALIRVPGSATPVVVATAHFNSRHASGVADSRSDYAYRRQLDAAGHFLATSGWHDYPIIFAGDFNVGRSSPRRQSFATAIGRWWRGTLADAMHDCRSRRSGFPVAAEESFRRAKDWQLFGSTRLARLSVDAIRVPFGRAADGRMLSDHFGYTALFSLHEHH